MLSLHPSGLKRAALSVFALMSCDPAGAQLVSYEGFGEYDAGVQVESGANQSEGIGLSGGSGWGGVYNVSDFIKSLVLVENRTASPVNYENGAISIPGGNRALRFYGVANGSPAMRRPLSIPFQAAAGDTLWFSLLFRTNNASPLFDQDFFQIGFDDNANPTNGNPRVSIGANTTSSSFPGDFRFFARSTRAVGNSVYASGPAIAAVTTYLLVACVRSNAGVYDTVSLFVNPSSADDPGPPSASVNVSSGLATLSHLFIRTDDLELADAYVLDEWRIGRDYGSVVQSLKAPQVLRIEPADIPGDPPRVRWHSSLTGVVLETSTTLAPGSWTAVPGPFELYGADHEHPVPSGPGVTRAFFRLRR